MKKIKPGEHKGTLCEVCKAPAQWRASQYYRAMYTCGDHKEEIQKAETSSDDDGYMSEADMQTWGKI